MGTTIDANTPLDYIEFYIFPSLNRYDASVCYLNKKEKVSSGLVEHLLLLSPDIRTLHSNGSNVKHGLGQPENSHDIKWFTKSTLIRFLHIVGSPNILEVTNSLTHEICQLEESRQFHLSLYTKDSKLQHVEESDGRDSRYSNSKFNDQGSDASMNELLRAMDLRLTTLRGELMAAFDQAAGSRYSVEEMTDIEKFSQHFGSRDLSDSLHQHVELLLGAQLAEKLGSNRFPESNQFTMMEENRHVNEFAPFEPQVRYGASPAKAAMVERQSSTGSDESSFSSEEELQQERSGPLLRSATPRRSASPMRRVQIGRSGMRRSTAIAIKSLNHFPARERSFLPKDAASDSEEHGSLKEHKNSDSNVRISVQDAISLFERKQRDQKVDIRKSGSSSNTSLCANKSVLRRWSTGICQNASEHQQDICGEDAVNEIQNITENREIRHDSQVPGSQPDSVLEDNPIETRESDTKMDSSRTSVCGLMLMQEEAVPAELVDVSEKLTASAEWNCQKEAELNELLTKMMEAKPVKGRNVVPADINKRHSLPSERRGGFYDHYMEKRDEKLRGEAASKQAEKDKQFGARPRILAGKKTEPASPNASDAVRKHNVKKMQKPERSITKLTRIESPKPASVKKASPRMSSLSAARKSWPSAPSGRAPGSSPAKTPPAAASTSTMPTRLRSQPVPPVSRPNQKIETSLKGCKSAKLKQNDSKKSQGNATEKKEQSLKRSKKTVASKVQTIPDDLASAAKPSMQRKVMKKSSIVPLESKSVLRKGSVAATNANPALKKKMSSQEVLRELANTNPDEENVVVSNPCDPVNEETEIGEKREVLGSAAITRSPTTGDFVDVVVEPELKPENEEETIAPTAWVEKEDSEKQSLTSEFNGCEMVDLASATAPVEISNLKIHHSLSQMLLEETSEGDGIEWGNAENPPQVGDHRDAPKGLKRLLKFGRKSKADANAGGWSSPSVFSEVEDDAEDSTFGNKKNGMKLFFSLSAFKGSR